MTVTWPHGDHTQSDSTWFLWAVSLALCCQLSFCLMSAVIAITIPGFIVIGLQTAVPLLWIDLGGIYIYICFDSLSNSVTVKALKKKKCIKKIQTHIFVKFKYLPVLRLAKVQMCWYYLWLLRVRSRQWCGWIYSWAMLGVLAYADNMCVHYQACNMYVCRSHTGSFCVCFHLLNVHVTIT